ncbi:hypothetical protein [Gordonia malaquae]|uniref:hypothetical protein n=1 Tax=Gordonia malaquae TaxID=410332 RepID=UPI0030FE1F22
MIINPFKLAPGQQAYGYRYYFGVLVAFVALSVAGNMAYYMVPEIPTAVVALSHGAPPVVFALMVHLGLTLSTSFAGSVRRPGPRAPRERSHIDRASLALVGVLVLSVAVVAGIALVVSFTGLEGLAGRMGWGAYTWTLPVLLDVPAGIATIGVLMAMHAIKADALTATADAVSERAQQAVEALAPVAQAVEQATEQSRLSGAQSAQTDAQSSVDRGPAAHPVNGPAQDVEHVPVAVLNHRVQRTDQSADLDLSDFDDDVLRRLERDDPHWLSGLRIEIGEHTEQSVEHGVEQPAQTIEQAIEQTPEPVSEHRVEQRSDEVLNGAMELRTMAERAHRELAPKVSVETLTELIAAHREGATQRQLGEIAGVSPNTAVKYVHAAERLAS